MPQLADIEDRLANMLCSHAAKAWPDWFRKNIQDARLEIMKRRGQVSWCRPILENMAAENERPWWNFWTPRWPISHEPIRGDARYVLPLIDELLARL
jgi:hypothetical protein